MLVLARRFRGLYTTYPTYMITPAKSGQRTRYDTCENIPLAIVTSPHLFPFSDFLLACIVCRREKWNMPEPLEIPHVKLERRHPLPLRHRELIERRERILNDENSLDLYLIIPSTFERSISPSTQRGLFWNFYRQWLALLVLEQNFLAESGNYDKNASEN